jgi:hypothetical protein
MLVCNYKPTCSYSFTVSLPFKHEHTARRTLRYRWRFVHCKLGLRPITAKVPALSFVTSHLRPRVLPRYGLALLEWFIQSP